MVVEAFEVLEDVDFNPWQYRIRAPRGARIVYHWDDLGAPYRNAEHELAQAAAQGKPPGEQAEYRLRCEIWRHNTHYYKVRGFRGLVSMPCTIFAKIDATTGAVRAPGLRQRQDQPTILLGRRRL